MRHRQGRNKKSRNYTLLAQGTGTLVAQASGTLVAQASVNKCTCYKQMWNKQVSERTTVVQTSALEV